MRNLIIKNSKKHFKRLEKSKIVKNILFFIYTNNGITPKFDKLKLSKFGILLNLRQITEGV